ncbi:MAG: HD domain-containing protein [Ktedonobacteraceae bacterium]
MDTQTLNLLHQTAQFFKSQRTQAYLVGGSLRNLLLEVDCSDWDIVTAGDAPSLARRLADTLGGYYVYLHDKVSRVVVPISEPGEQKRDIIFDIAPLKGLSLEEDLRLRDFTINAMAAPLDDVVRYLNTGQALHLIDPLHGLPDLEARRLKAVDSEVFRHDPLRMLRAVRLMAFYQLSIDIGTQGLLMRDATLLQQVAPERIHDELYAILERPGAIEHLHFLDDHGLLTVLMPEFIPARGMPQPQPHYWDVLEHSLQTVDKLEMLVTQLQRPAAGPGQSPPERSSLAGNLTEIQQLLYEAEEQGIFQLALLAAPRMKLAALLHDIGKPATFTTDEEGHIHFYGHPQAGVPLALQVMRRLSASTQDRRLVQQVTTHHMRPGQLGKTGMVTPRAIRRYFVELGPTGIAVALFSLADHLATRGPLLAHQLSSTDDKATLHSWEQHVAVVSLLLTRYIRQRESILPPRLLSAEELMRRFDLKPGPRVGQLLEAIAEAQADGSVRSREEAFWFAEERLQHIE